MDGLSQGVELLHFAKDPDNSEWYVCQMACDGTLAVTFSVQVPVVHNFKNEQALGEYLERQARNLIDRYGDARAPKPDPVLMEA